MNDMELKIEQGIELLMKSIPYSNQIKNIEFKERSIYFYWRSSRWKMDCQCCRIDMANGVLLEANDTSLLMTQLIKNNLGLFI